MNPRDTAPPPWPPTPAPAKPTRTTLFGKPVVPCGRTEVHEWHGDGATYCTGGQE